MDRNGRTEHVHYSNGDYKWYRMYNRNSEKLYGQKMKRITVEFYVCSLSRK